MLLLLFVALVLYAAAFLWWATGIVPARGRELQLPPPQQDLLQRLQEHVESLTSLGPHNAAQPDALRQAAAYVRGQMGASEEAYELSGTRYVNLVKVVPGTAPGLKMLVVGAHYDTDENTPGADDNSSGVAALIELARKFADNPQPRTIAFVAFTNEEEPYFQTRDMGSHRYAEAHQHEIHAMLSLEMLGVFDDREKTQHWISRLWGDRGNYLAFVGDFRARFLMPRAVRAFRRATAIPAHGACVPRWLPYANWSDHWSFWEHDIPAILITDTAPLRNKRYHLKTDTPETLHYAAMTHAVIGLQDVIEDLAK